MLLMVNLMTNQYSLFILENKVVEEKGAFGFNSLSGLGRWNRLWNSIRDEYYYNAIN